MYCFKYVLFTSLGAGIAAFALWSVGPGVYTVEPAEDESWVKIKPDLDAFDQQADAARDRRLAALHDFFHQREKGSAGFAEDALSWGGKWALAKQTLRVGEPASKPSFFHH